LAVWQKLLQTLGLRDSIQPETEEEKFKFSLNHHPSEGELNSMIEFWERQRNDTKWDDLGFKLKGETDTRWLSHSIARNKFDLNVQRKNDEIIDAKLLLKALVERRIEVLNLLQDV
jgi:hypothetical protein